MTDAQRAQLETALAQFRAQRFAEAEATCRALLAEDRDCGPAWQRLALTCDRLGRVADAIAAFEAAIRLLDDPGQAHHNLAVLLHQQGDGAGALIHYRRAIAAGCADPLLDSNLGCLLRDEGQMQAGADQLRRAVAANPDLAHPQSNLGVTLCLQGRVAEGLVHLRLATVLAPDWPVAFSNMLFCLNYADDLPPAGVASAHRLFGRRFALAATGAVAPIVDVNPDRPLRIGLLSPDFRQHSVAYFLEPLLAARDPARVAYFAYASWSHADAVTSRLRRLCDGWRAVDRLSDAEAAAAMRADRLDVLIDLAGHTAHNRLGVLALRPAPVQMTYLGYPNTTGLDAVDWRITDRWADPPGLTEALHSERLLRLTDGFLCYRPPTDGPPVSASPADASGKITFATFNQLAKLSPTTIALWGRVLAAVPGARLLIKGPAFADAATRAAFAEQLGSSALGGHDVQLLPPVSDERHHLAAYDQVDIALDPTPYGGTTTTCEALWMGVPVITLAGATHAARVGASLLSRLGLPDLVAATADEYVRIAATLAADSDRRRTLRAGLRALTTTALTDGPRFARGFESALRTAWEDGVQRQAAAAPALPPETTLLSMAGDVRIAVSTRADQITAYVVREQHDWFEEEIAFVRAAVNRAERAIDVGANHGVYALALARAVGADGKVWAFEPHPTAAARLRASIAANHFDQLQLIEAALSDHVGQGRLSSGPNSELAALGGGNDDGDFTVPLTTLDQAAHDQDLRDVAFMKIDAEGAEPAIIDGGRDFLQRESPLLMFEVRHGAGLHRPTIDAVARLNYDRFRLVPGLLLLAPAPDLELLDPFTLNLFACRPDRAQALAAAGWLVTRVQAVTPAPGGSWLGHLRPLAIARSIGIGWRGRQHDDEAAHFAALDHYALAQRPLDPPGARLAHLMKAIEHESEAVTARPSLPVLQTLARLAWEAGFRAVAVQTLNTLISRCLEGDSVEAAIPFLPACPRFDQVALAGDDLRSWILAAALEQRERLRAFSSFYTARDPATLQTLETIAHLGYQSPEMARRLALVRQRVG
ncbi:MAG TPA: FkbM family methyltransferase [Polyangia bacterium]|nr:FkbM family methyltransferase [Polyangia bacterium]